MRSPDTAARSVRGRLLLHFTGRGGATRLVSAERTPPFHVQRLLFLDPDRPALATAVVLNGTAGLFAGDRLELDITVEAGAMVSLTTPAMTRAFAMEEGAAELSTRLQVCAGGYAELLPRPLLLCAGSCVDQRLEALVEPGGALAIGEVVAFGRAASGEGYAFRRFEQRVLLRLAGEPVLAERLALDSDEAADPGLLGGYAAYGSLNLIGDRGNDSLLAAVRRDLDRHGNVWGGASLLRSGAGVAVRLFGRRAHTVQAALQTVRTTFRSVRAA